MTNEQLALLLEKIASDVRAIDARFKLKRLAEAEERTSNLSAHLERDINMLLGIERTDL